jgi:hypothetical protein
MTKTIALFTLLALAGCSRGVTNAEIVRATALCSDHDGIDYIKEGWPNSTTVVVCRDSMTLAAPTAKAQP